MTDYSDSKIVQALVATGKWGERAAIIGERAGFKCEYCDRDLFASVNDYKAWQEDHIVPISKDGDERDLENIALSCRTCNFNLKSRWDPRDKCKENASREELIGAVREYVARKRTEVLQEVIQFRELVYGPVKSEGNGS